MSDFEVLGRPLEYWLMIRIETNKYAEQIAINLL